MSWLSLRHSCLLVALAACLACAQTSGSGAWPSSAGDRPRGTVVVSNMNDNTASILDAGTGRTLATIATGEGPHEVAVSHDGRWALVSNYGVRGKPGNTLTVIDVANRTVVRTIDLGQHQRPHGMAFFPGDTVVAVTAQASNAVLLVDPRTGRVTDTMPSLGRGTHMLALSASGRHLITGNIGDATITLLSPGSARAGTLITVAAQPEGVTISPDGATAWAGSNKDSIVVVVDLGAGRVVDTLRAFGMPYRLAISPDGRRAVITDPVKGEVRIFDAATRRQLFRISVPRDSIVATAEVPGSPSPEGVTISADSRWAFVTLQGRNRLATIDLARGTIVALAPIGTWSDGVGYSPLVAPRP
ncbi:MAG: beta-propeller fold lactonase family protein [Gemmatimonadaceae bacterium]